MNSISDWNAFFAEMDQMNSRVEKWKEFVYPHISSMISFSLYYIEKREKNIISVVKTTFQNSPMEYKPLLSNYGMISLTIEPVEPFFGKGMFLDNNSLNVEIPISKKIPHKFDILKKYFSHLRKKIVFPCIQNTVFQWCNESDINYEENACHYKMNFVVTKYLSRSKAISILFDYYEIDIHYGDDIPNNRYLEINTIYVYDEEDTHIAKKHKNIDGTSFWEHCIKPYSVLLLKPIVLQPIKEKSEFTYLYNESNSRILRTLELFPDRNYILATAYLKKENPKSIVQYPFMSTLYITSIVKTLDENKIYKTAPMYTLGIHKNYKYPKWNASDGIGLLSVIPEYENIHQIVPVNVVHTYHTDFSVFTTFNKSDLWYTELEIKNPPKRKQCFFSCINM